MRHRVFYGCLLAACVSGTIACAAQEVVHAVAGTVTSINPTSKTFLVDTDDGSEGRFTTVAKPDVTLDIPKPLRANVTPAATFAKTKARVLVFYVGDDSVRSAVALEDLGAGPFVKSSGTIVKFDKHAHVLTIKNAAGADETFHVDDKTIAEAAEGVEEAGKFDAQRGDKVRITARSANGTETALFIRSL